MAPTSQNGWPANDRSVVSSRPVPGTTVRVSVRNGPAGDLLLAVAGLFHRLVEPIDVGQPDDWGYAQRPIRGGQQLSNHASGTAIDLNATRHPLGTPPERSFSPQQIAAIRAILDRTGGVVRWGGDYATPARGGVAGSRPDPMHFEINDHQTETTCTAALAALTADGDFLVSLTAAEQDEILRGIRALKPGVALPNRSANIRGGHALADGSKGDDHFGQSMNGAAEAADARVAAENALRAVQELTAALRAKGII